MKVFEFTYYREQRVDFEIEAKDITEAELKAHDKLEEFDLDSKDDMSDDPGELELREECRGCLK